MNEMPILATIAILILGSGYMILVGFIMKWLIKFAIKIITEDVK